MTEQAARPLRRELHQLATASVSVGVMAPTLAMSVTGAAAASTLGRAAPLAFAVAAVGVALVAFGFIRLAHEYAHAGSVYAFVGRALHPRAGFLAGWALLGTYLVFPPVSVVGIAVFGQALLRVTGLAPNTDWYAIAVAGWLAIVWLALRGIRPTTRSLLAFETISVLLILALVAVILTRVGTGSAPVSGAPGDILRLPSGVGAHEIALAATAGFLAFAGFESAGSLGEESLHPRRTVPRALIISVGFGAVFYVICMIAQTLGFGSNPAGVARFAGSAAPLGDLAQRYVGAWLAVLLDAGAVLSALGAGLGGVTVGSRMLFALGRDGAAPRSLAALTSRGAIPARAIAVEGGAALGLLTTFRLIGAKPLDVFFYLATMGVLSLLVMYVLTNLAAARLMIRRSTTGTVLSLVGAAVAGYVLYRNVWPLPPAPYPVLVGIVGVWFGLGAVLAIVLGHRVLLGRGVEPVSPAPAM
jgi:amino acid transporter